MINTFKILPFLLFINQFALLAASDSAKYTDEVFIRPTRFEKGYNNSVTFLKVSAIENINTGADVPALLQQIPSLTFSSDAGNNIGYTNLRLRGSDQTRVNVAFNGIPYNDPESQGVFWVNIADILSSSNEVQIQRGLGFSVVGAGAFGGNININTFKLTAKPSISINNSVGSFNTSKNNILFNTGLINNLFQLKGRLSRISSSGYIERASSNLYSGNLDWTIQHKKMTMFTTYFFGSERTYQAWNGVSEADLLISRRVNYAGTDWGANTGEPYKDEVDRYRQHNFQWHLNYVVSNELNFKTSLFYTQGQGYYEEFKVNADLLNYGFSTSVNTDLARRRWLRNDFYGGIMSLEYAPKSWKIETTVAWNQYDGDHFGEIINTFGKNNLTTPYQYYFNKGIKTDVTSFVKISKKFNKILLLADLQYRNVGYMVNGNGHEQLQYNTQNTFQFFNPKFGINYTLNAQSSLNVYVGYGNKEPERADMLNSANTVKHEEMLNVELGYFFKKGNNHFSLNSFLMNYTNQLVLTGSINDVGSYFKMNVPKSYRAGIEAEANWQVNPRWNINANITWSVNKISAFNHVTYTYDENYQKVDSLTQIENLENKDISFSPSLVGYAEVSYTPIKSLTFSLQNKYVSAQYLDNTQREEKKLDAYFYNNVNIAYSFALPKEREIKFILQLNNILDQKFESNGYTVNGGRLVDNTGRITPETNYNYYYPQAGFNFMFGLNIKL